MSRRHSREYHEGWSDRQAELLPYNNPYEPGSREFDDWSNGYESCREYFDRLRDEIDQERADEEAAERAAQEAAVDSPQEDLFGYQRERTGGRR